MASSNEIALLRLAAQRVVGPASSSPEEAVGWLGAAQGQDLAGAMTSIALRTVRRSVDDVVAAFDGGRIVRSWPMRGTLHVVRAEDLAWMTELMAPRPMAAAAKRRGQLGLDDSDVARARDVVTQALTGGHAMTRGEVLARWEEAGLATSGGRGYHLLAHLAQARVLCLGPMRGKDQAFVLLEEWVPSPRRPARDEALAELGSRYFQSHGPATKQDLARWSGLAAADVRAAIAGSERKLDTVTLDGQTYYLDPRTSALLDAHRGAAEAVHLLPGFDEVVLGYGDRSATVPLEHAARIVPGGNGVFRPTVLHRGVAVATWRSVGKGTTRRVVTEAFTTLDRAVQSEISARFASLP